MSASRDHRDLALEDLAYDLVVMTERAVFAEADRDLFRELSITAIEQLHALTGRVDYLTRRNGALLDDVRRFQLAAQVGRQAAA
jgi:hypothetical protein